MDEKITNVLNALCEKFGVAVDWTQENVIPYVETLAKKYIAYEIATSVTWIIIFLALTVVSFLIANPLSKKASSLEYPWDADEDITWAAGIACVITIIFGIIFIVVACVQTIDIVTCLTFPEKMIIEYISSLT